MIQSPDPSTATSRRARMATVPTVQDHAQPPPRKRRRKTASGAAEDCFHCKKRAVACDRKRPYCSQCIDVGKECSGYKTTLTWNVGVASRGKLRGLSCPVMSKGSNDSTVNVADAARRRKNSASSPKIKSPTAKTTTTAFHNHNHNHSHSHTSAPTSAPLSANAPSPYRPSLPTITSREEAWHNAAFQDHFHFHSHEAPAIRPTVLRHPSLQHIQTAFGTPYDAFSVSGSSTGSVTDEYHSPLEYPQTPNSIAYHEPFPPLLIPHSAPPLSSPVDSYGHTLSSSMDSVHSGQLAFPDTMMMEHNEADHEPFTHGIPGQASVSPDDLLFPTGFDMSVATQYHSFDQPNQQTQEDDSEIDVTSLSLLDPRFSSPFFSATPRLQSLMEYYDRFVCPYLVAFDGPENPYRRHILQLAVHNEGLQNAVAALAMNNFRMRRQQSGQVGFVEEITDAYDEFPKPNNKIEPTPEETCYKQMSIDQLNLQLTDMRAAQDDSVVATLLILCLFHVCDSGFSKFKTQLAGVQKLLSLRSPNGQSEFTRWIEMFFLWFDVMTSAVNDREMQIKGESLDMFDFSADLGAVEQFSGCDGRLFKLIARLGRLNLLAQGRPVRPQEGARQAVPRHSFTNNKNNRKRKFQQHRPLSAADYERIDGNGWGTPINPSDEETDGDAEEKPGYTVPDDRREFWDEWNDIRSRLQGWQMDVAFNGSPPPSSTSAPEFEMGQRDLLHINESFRYSALLYTERLGHPVLPSSHPNFQSYVSKALYHITALEITSCVNKFLLWPLFIIGTECVDEAHRNIIRARCHEVTKESGFYNNMSGLEVLEKVWREVGNNIQGMEAAEIKARRRDSEAGRTGRYGQAFRWRKAMDRVDGEYIVI